MAVVSLVIVFSISLMSGDRCHGDSARKSLFEIQKIESVLRAHIILLPKFFIKFLFLSYNFLRDLSTNWVCK